MSDFIPVNVPHLLGNEKQYLNECIDTGWISSEGKFVSEFESKLSKRLGREHGVAVTNGTAALDIAFELLKLKPGDEVIVPTFTIISCVLHIVRAGAKPVFVDCDANTWNMDVSVVENKITPRTRAILAVHIYGLPVNLAPLMELAKKYSLFLIEDAAEAIGQTYCGKPCGSFGLVSTVSFYPNKHITTGEGGMVFTDDPELHSRAKELRNLCFVPEQRFHHQELGWNLRMSNLQAAVGVAQLEKLEASLQRKKQIGRMYSELLKDVDGLQIPIEKLSYADNVYWVFGIVLDKSLGSAKSMMKKLAENGVGTRPFFKPLHTQPALEGFHCSNDAEFQNANLISKQGLYLPSGLGITDDQIEIVGKKLKDLI